jgi:hypothetical protein
MNESSIILAFLLYLAFILRTVAYGGNTTDFERRSCRRSFDDDDVVTYPPRCCRTKSKWDIVHSKLFEGEHFDDGAFSSTAARGFNNQPRISRHKTSTYHLNSTLNSQHHCRSSHCKKKRCASKLSTRLHHCTSVKGVLTPNFEV